jgi:hypothetical protein
VEEKKMPITKETISHLPDLTEIITETNFSPDQCGLREAKKLRKILPVVEIAEIMGSSERYCLDGDNHKYWQTASLIYVAGTYKNQFLIISNSRIVRDDLRKDNYMVNPQLIEFSSLETYTPLGVVGDRK